MERDSDKIAIVHLVYFELRLRRGDEPGTRSLELYRQRQLIVEWDELTRLARLVAGMR